MYHEMMTHHRLYEHETTGLLLQHLRPGDVFIDVGAHIGWFTVWASRFVGNQGSVYAFEPEPYNYKSMLNTLEMNGCINVVTRRSVVSDHDGESVLYVNQDNDGGHSLWDCSRHDFNQKTKLCGTSILVPCTTLDSFCFAGKVGQIRMVKIDTEGAEVLVLRGALELLSISAIDYVVCEVNQSGLEMLGSNANEMHSIMEDNGYHLSHRDDVEPGCVFNVMFAREGL
jgi:FkbM family methyltransferase